MPRIQVRRIDRRKPESNWLNTHAASVFSQNGEDGVLTALFETIGTLNRWCVEFGAYDGVKFSNTCNLIRNHHWSSVQIEGNRRRFQLLQQNYANTDNVHCLNAMVECCDGNSLDRILSTVTSLPRDLDLLVMDIDGNEWHIWESLHCFNPRVVVVEFNPGIPNDVSYVQDNDCKINQGSSLLAFIELGHRKGYELCAIVGANAFFVARKDFKTLGINDNCIDAMFLPRADGRMFLLYDGTLVNCGLSSVRLRQKDPKRRDLDPFQFQVYAEHERGYGGAVNRCVLGSD